jgi:hypothetical protein
MEHPAMPVGPIHHWRDREKKIVGFRIFFGHLSYLQHFHSSLFLAIFTYSRAPVLQAQYR